MFIFLQTFLDPNSLLSWSRHLSGEVPTRINNDVSLSNASNNTATHQRSESIAAGTSRLDRADSSASNKSNNSRSSRRDSRSSRSLSRDRSSGENTRMSLHGAAPFSSSSADVSASAQAEGLRWLRKVRWKIGRLFVEDGTQSLFGRTRILLGSVLESVFKFFM